MKDQHHHPENDSSLPYTTAKNSNSAIKRKRVSPHKMAALALLLTVPALLAGCGSDEEAYDEYCYDTNNDDTITYEECPQGSYYEDDDGGFYYVSSTNKRYRAKPSTYSSYKSSTAYKSTSKSGSFKGFGSSGSSSIGG